MDQYPLFPGHKGPSETGALAAAAIAPKVKSIRERTLEAIERRPSTPEQIAKRIGVHWLTVRARCSELRAIGLITDSDRRGIAALGGTAIMWRATTAQERADFMNKQQEAA